MKEQAAACRAQGGLRLALQAATDAAVSAHQRVEGTQSSAQTCVSEEGVVAVTVKVDKHQPFLLSPQHSLAALELNTFQTSSSQPQLEIVASFQGRDHSFANKYSSSLWSLSVPAETPKCAS